MPMYKPTAIAYQESGLVRDRQAFVTPNDAYVELENAYVWRGITKRRNGYDLLGRLRRLLSTFTYFTTGASPWSINLLSESGGIQDIDISGAPTLVITTGGEHGLSNGDQVVFTGVGGTTQLNGNTYTIANVTTDTFEVTQAGPGAFTSGGFWFSNRSLATQEPDANIECGSVVITLDVGVTDEVLTDQGDGTLTSAGASSGTINYSTGAVVITHAYGAGVAVSVAMNYFPSLPVMGICQRELNTINLEDMVCFDTKYSYQFSSGSGFSETASTFPVKWQGDDVEFFWWSNYYFDANQNKYFWVTNGNNGGTVGTSDPIRYYNGTTWNTTAFLPSLKSTAATGYLITAELIIPYRGRLVALNTTEASNNTAATATTNHPNRARWSQNGDPTNIAASTTGGWIDDIQGYGGFVDAPTNESIISAAFIRDTLIVFFERSTWKLRYTGNEILPFVFERINIELGAESQFSPIKFDEGVLAVGDKGIITCNGNNVKRIDENVRDEVFKIHNGNNGVQRVHGIRNFFEQVVYWTFPNADVNGKFPNRILLYNYDNQTWAFFKDSFTVFGTYQATTDKRWSDLTDETWESYLNTWDSGKIQSAFPQIVGGNQQGYIEILNQKIVNDASLFIKSIAAGPPTVFTSPNHNLENGDIVELSGIVSLASTDAADLNGYRFVVTGVDNQAAPNEFQLKRKPRFTVTAVTKAENAVVTAAGHNLGIGDYAQFANLGGMTELNNQTGKVIAVSGTTFTIDINSLGFTTYTTGGTVENLMGLTEAVTATGGTDYLGCGQISKVESFRIRSKKFNMLNVGRKTQLGYMDFFVDKTENGEVNVPVFVDYNEDQRVNERGSDSFFNWGFETSLNDFSTANQSKEWHRMYCNTEAAYFQYELNLDEAQTLSKEIQGSGFNLNAIIIWHEKGGRLTN